MDVLDVLITIAAEFVAMHDDAKVRKFVAKREIEKLPQLAREFRAQGRYLGGPGSNPGITQH